MTAWHSNILLFKYSTLPSLAFPPAFGHRPCSIGGMPLLVISLRSLWLPGFLCGFNFFTTEFTENPQSDTEVFWLSVTSPLASARLFAGARPRGPSRWACQVNPSRCACRVNPSCWACRVNPLRIFSNELPLKKLQASSFKLQVTPFVVPTFPPPDKSTGQARWGKTFWTMDCTRHSSLVYRDSPGGALPFQVLCRLYFTFFHVLKFIVTSRKFQVTSRTTMQTVYWDCWLSSLHSSRNISPLRR